MLMPNVRAVLYDSAAPRFSIDVIFALLRIPRVTNKLIDATYIVDTMRHMGIHHQHFLFLLQTFAVARVYNYDPAVPLNRLAMVPDLHLRNLANGLARAITYMDPTARSAICQVFYINITPVIQSCLLYTSPSPRDA